MNELKFLEAIGKIDGDLIKEADVEKKKTFPKRKIYAFGSAAAVAAIHMVNQALLLIIQSFSPITMERTRILLILFFLYHLPKNLNKIQGD